MKLDVLIISDNLFDTYRGFTLTGLRSFLKSYPYQDVNVFIRETPKGRFRFNWRILPNRSTEYYRCPRVDLKDNFFLDDFFNNYEVTND